MAVSVTRVEAPGAGVVGGDEEGQVVRDCAGGRFRRGQEGGAGAGPLAILSDEEEPEVGRSREDPAREDPGHPGEPAVRRHRDDHAVARRAAPRERGERRAASRAVAREEG